MAYLTKAERNILITATATLFVRHTRDANEIAALLDTTNRSVHRWSKEPLWHEVLDTLGYEGERNFRVQPVRDIQGNPNFVHVKTAYEQAQREGVPKHRRVRRVAEQTGVKDGTIRYWVRRYGWDT